MKSEWKVTSQYFENMKKFAVYRIRDTNEPDHGGNREYATDYIDDRQEAQEIADRLNKEMNDW